MRSRPSWELVIGYDPFSSISLGKKCNKKKKIVLKCMVIYNNKEKCLVILSHCTFFYILYLSKITNLKLAFSS